MNRASRKNDDPSPPASPRRRRAAANNNSSSASSHTPAVESSSELYPSVDSNPLRINDGSSNGGVVANSVRSFGSLERSGVSSSSQLSMSSGPVFLGRPTNKSSSLVDDDDTRDAADVFGPTQGLANRRNRADNDNSAVAAAAAAASIGGGGNANNNNPLPIFGKPSKQNLEDDASTMQSIGAGGASPSVASIKHMPPRANSSSANNATIFGRKAHRSLDEDDDDDDDDDNNNNINGDHHHGNGSLPPGQALPLFGKPAARKGGLDDDSTVGTTGWHNAVGNSSNSFHSGTSHNNNSNNTANAPLSLFGRPARRGLDDESTVATNASPMLFQPQHPQIVPANAGRNTHRNLHPDMFRRSPPPSHRRSVKDNKDVVRDGDVGGDNNNHNNNADSDDDRGFARKPPPATNSFTRGTSWGNDGGQPTQPGGAATSLTSPVRPKKTMTTTNADAATNTTTAPGAVAKQSSHPLNPENMTEEDMLEAAIKASQEKQPDTDEDMLEAAIKASQQKPPEVTVDSAKIETWKYNARMVREICSSEHGVDLSILEFALKECQSDLEAISSLLGRQSDDSQVEMLLDLNGIVLNAIETGNETAEGFQKKRPPVHTKPHEADRKQSATTAVSVVRTTTGGGGGPASDLDVAELVKVCDIFSLICMLRSQDEARMQAALALMRFARSATQGDAEATRVRGEIRSLGGMHSLLALFRTRGTLYELKVVAAIAVAHIVPSFDVSDSVKPSLALKILECLRFLSTARSVTPLGESINQKECLAAAGMALTTFWVDQLEPLLHKQDEPLPRAPLVSSVSLNRRQSSGATRGKGKSGEIFDKRREAIEVQELLDMTVSLIIKIARHVEKGMIGGDPVLLVEQMCAVEIARPIAVREGILTVLVGWIRGGEKEKIRPASVALRSLTSTKDKYMAGWIHSQMVNEGALPGIVLLTQDISLTQDVRLAIAQILSSLCVAPHTRAAVLESDCVHFLIDILYDHSDPSSQEVALYAGSALLQLAAGAITRASVFYADDAEFTGFVTLDKRETLVDDIVQRGAIASFVSIALHRYGELRRVAIEALRVLSEDVSPGRLTRLQLCEDGAAEALGRTLTDNLEQLFGALEGKVSFAGDMETNMKELHGALCTLANILQPIDYSPSLLGDGRHMKDTKALLIAGCMQTVESGGLDSLLKVISLPTESVVPGASQLPRTFLMSEACRSLASISPLLLSEPVASAGNTTWAGKVLISTTRLLDKVLDKNEKHDEEHVADIHVSILQAIGALAQSAPLRVRIIDTLLPHLIQAKNSRERTEISKAAALAFEWLDFSQDAEAAQVAGNNASLLADWFCLKRSLLLQTMSRIEIVETVRKLWNMSSVPSKAELERHTSGGSNFTGCSSTSFELFDGLALDEDTLALRTSILKQYTDIYRGIDGSRRLPSDSARSPLDSMLSRQVFPMTSSNNEASWILDHQEAVDSGLKPTTLNPHVSKLLETCLPCRLLRDYIVPINSLRPTASFDFRALMMPQRRYFSFSREGKLLKRLCAVEAGSVASSNVHWTLGFTNSSFAGEFSESLVRALYLSPMIRGLSFARDKEWKRIQALESESKVEDGGTILANLTAAVPAWISCLSFKGVIKNQDLVSLISTLEKRGKLSSGRENLEVLTTEEQSFGQFWFFAITHCTDISVDAWSALFRMIGSTAQVPQRVSTSPIASLRALDLSYNELGDNLCGVILERIHDEKAGCIIERLDLSGNFIGEGSSVLKVFFDYVQNFRRDELSGQTGSGKKWKAPLHTLRLADNNFHVAKAWLEIIALVKNNALELQVLDLSENELSLDENSYDCEVLVSSIQKNSSLCNLNLSKNQFSQSSVDEILCQLGKHGHDSGLAFLDLSNNSPELSTAQTSALEAILENSRTFALQSYFNTKDAYDNEFMHDDFSNFRRLSHAVPVNGQRDGGDDESTTIADRPKTVAKVEEGEQSLNNMITVLFSAPLVFLDTSGVIRPFEKLDFNMERELLWQCLKEASRDIHLSFDSASSKRLLATMTKQCSCLHYSGHGHPDYLAFEDEAGGPHWFHSQQIKDLIASREGSAPFQFVFVSACYSGLAGETFASAGVPHVVCCQQESELKDAAALAFTRQFYLALAIGHTVKYSFEQACKAVRATPNLREADQEMEKFVLLPKDGNHDVPLFDAKPVVEWPKPPKERSTKGRRSQRHNKPTRGVGAGTIELSVRNMIQEDPSPSPPQFFLGREVDMYHVLTKVLSKRLVSVVGESGMGRSSLVCALSHYICERASTMSLIEHIYYVKVKEGSKACAVRNLVAQLLDKLVEAGRLDNYDQETDVETMFDLVCDCLKTEKSLVVFDHLEVLEGCDEANEFPVLLSNFFRKTRNVRVLLTAHSPLGIPSLGGQVENHHTLGPLNFASTVRLYSRLSPFLYTPADQRKFVETLVPNETEEEFLPDNSELPDPVRRIFAAMGDGVPSRIEKAAYNAADSSFFHLKSGDIRKEEEIDSEADPNS